MDQCVAGSFCVRVTGDGIPLGESSRAKLLSEFEHVFSAATFAETSQRKDRVLAPSAVGGVTLRRYGAVSYTRNGARDLRHVPDHGASVCLARGYVPTTNSQRRKHRRIAGRMSNDGGRRARNQAPRRDGNALHRPHIRGTGSGVFASNATVARRELLSDVYYGPLWSSARFLTATAESRLKGSLDDIETRP